VKFLITCALGVAVLTGLPSATAAQSGEPHKKSYSAPAAKKPPSTRPSQQDPHGRWDQSWGNRPPPPPRHWSKKGDWHRHVRACQKAYRSYNARTDTYRSGSEKTRRCAL